MSVAYRYDHFKREVLMGDMSFKTGPGPGQPFPDFDLETTDGPRVQKGQFVGRQPVLMTFGSFT